MWTDDRAQIAFASTRLGEGLLQMFKKPVDGSATAAPILSEDERDSIVFVPMSWSPHARALAFYKGRTLASTLSTGAVGDIWVLPEAGPPAAFVAGQFNNRSPSFSQDGRWLAYTSDESGYTEVYARPYPGPGPRVAISTAGGTEPLWSRDGTELFYREDSAMMAVRIEAQEARLVAGTPEQLFEGSYAPDPITGVNPNYDVAPDGRFLMLRTAPDDGPVAQSLHVVINFDQELRRRVPTE